MAGERLATQTLYVTHATLTDGAWIDVWLHGAYVRFTGVLGAGTSVPASTPNQFVIYTVYNVQAEQHQDYTVNSFLYAVQQYLNTAGLAARYTVSRVTHTVVGTTEGIGCRLEATAYDDAYDFQFPQCRQVYANGGNGFGWSIPLTNTIRPVQVAVAVTNTGAFGTATGALVLTASNGTVGTYTYLWADAGAPFTATRSGLAAGSYACTVTDASGASTQVLAVVGSDARLDVLVTRTDNDVALVPSGGVAPYTYQWADGPTTATRPGLAVGTYTCTVTDARGATQQVTVTVDPYRFYWSQNPVTLALDAGAAYRLDPGTKPNLSFVCQVWVEDVYLSGVFEQVGPELEQPADRAGRTVFDAQALLDSYLAPHLPALNQTRPSRADSLFRRFYFRYAEKYGAPAPVAAALSTQAQHYVVLGGLDFYEAAAGTWFSSYQPAVKPFLTWEPTDKPVLPTQPEYLYFMPDDFTLTAFQVRVRVRYANNTTARLVAATVASARRFEVYCLPVGYQALGLARAADAGPAVHSWEVWVSDAQGAVHSEVRRFVLHTDYVARPRYFLYTTSLGGTATFACTGEAKTTLDVKAEEADRPQAPGYDPLLGDTLTLDRSGGPTLRVRSGRLRPAQLVAAQDLLLSPRVTLQVGATYFPGRLKPQAVPVADEAPGELPELEFDFLLPRQRRFSPRLPVVAVGQAIVPVRGGEGAQP